MCKLTYLFSNYFYPVNSGWLNFCNSWMLRKSSLLFNLILPVCDKCQDTCNWLNLFNLFYKSWDCVWIPGPKILHFKTVFISGDKMNLFQIYTKILFAVCDQCWYTSVGTGQVGSNSLHISIVQQEAVNFQAHIALISVTTIIFLYSARILLPRAVILEEENSWKWVGEISRRAWNAFFLTLDCAKPQVEVLRGGFIWRHWFWRKTQIFLWSLVIGIGKGISCAWVDVMRRVYRPRVEILLSCASLFFWRNIDSQFELGLKMKRASLFHANQKF